MIYLRHFKNFPEAEVSFDRPVTLLIGPNGAGKSNLIEAVELLCFIASGRPLHEITDLGRDGGLEVRGGLDGCAAFGQEVFTLGYKGSVPTADEVTYEISVRVGKEPRIIRESLKVKGRQPALFEVVPEKSASASGDNQVRYDNFARGKNKPTVVAAADRSALSQYSRFVRKNEYKAETLDLIDAVIKALAPPSVFDPVPKLMRGYERETETRLARNGFNLSPVLANLYRKPVPGNTAPKRNLQSPEAERILSLIRQLPDEPFKKFDFIRTDAGDVMFGFRANGEDKPATARILSDGTLRALAVLTALETGRSGQQIIIEEFDNGVHPSRVQLLTGALFDCSERNGLKSLVTTHNPATLNALTQEQLQSVLLVTHTPGAHGGRLIRLPDLPGYIEFIEQGRLGDLITRRVYEQHLSGPYEDDRRKELEKWLENLP